MIVVCHRCGKAGLVSCEHVGTYRGWSISYDPPPIPYRGADWQASSPNYDASYEGPEDGWVSNGENVSAATREELIAEIDAWLEENEQ